MAKKKEGICRGCGRLIFYDSTTRMWYFIEDGRARYYCTKDTNPERCQHLPR